MARVVFLNGSFIDFSDAKLSIMDRGFLFADGIYEVSAVLDGRMVHNEAHLTRLERSLKEVHIENPYPLPSWRELQSALIEKNKLKEGVVYIQVTRGVAERDFAFPKGNVPPTIAMFTQEKSILKAPFIANGVHVISTPDLRWLRRDIKSVSLLPQVLAKQIAAEAGAAEAWMIEDGFVTEGASSSAFIITKERRLLTRPLSHAILPGVTRQSILALAQEQNLTIEERLFSLDEAFDAHEAFLTSASTFVCPIVSIDGHQIGDGKPGPLTTRLRTLYVEAARLSGR